MTGETAAAAHSAMCLRLMQAFRRVSRGMRRWQDGAAPPVTAPLSPRHVAALEQLLGSPVTVGELASRLGLTLPTVSGVLADLDRAGFIERYPDPADRRRTIVQVIPAQAALIGEWLDDAARPLARVLDKLSPSEQEAFLKAMDLLEAELCSQDTRPCPGNYPDCGSLTVPRGAGRADGGGTTGPMSPSGASSTSAMTGA
jgi:DNA-binding MarR family transcriptional regulator